MGYAWSITVLAGTSDEEPKEELLPLHQGVITRIECFFPPGCCGEVKIRLFRGPKFQIFPLNKDGYVTGDGEPVGFNYYLDVSDRPRELIFQGSSPNCSHNHTIMVRITVLPKFVASMLGVIQLLTALLQRMGVIPR